MTVPLLIFDVENGNRQVYAKDCLKEVPNTLPIEPGIRDDWDNPQEPIGTATKIRVDGNLLVADVSIADEAAVDRLMSSCRFVPNGVGEYAADGSNRVVDFSLTYIAAIPKAESSFNGLYPDEEN